MQGFQLIFSSLFVILALYDFTVSTATSACDICSTKIIYGFGPGGTNGCECVGTGPTRSGPGGCICSQCFVEDGGRIVGYGYESGKKCPFKGVDCLACEDESSGSGTNSPTPTPNNETPSPSNSPENGSKDGSSNNGSQKNGNQGESPNDNRNTTKDGSSSGANTSKEGGSGGLQTWQITMIIASSVLAFLVVFMAILSCYCKTRRQLENNEASEDDARFYHANYSTIGRASGADANDTAMNRQTICTSNQETYPFYADKRDDTDIISIDETNSQGSSRVSRRFPSPKESAPRPSYQYINGGGSYGYYNPNAATGSKPYHQYPNVASDRSKYMYAPPPRPLSQNQYNKNNNMPVDL